MTKLFPLGMLENSGEKMVLGWNFWGLYGWHKAMPAEGLFPAECDINAKSETLRRVNRRLLLQGLGLLHQRRTGWYSGWYPRGIG